jgi:hypothetical protein
MIITKAVMDSLPKDARLHTGAAPDGCLRDHSASHTPGTVHDPSQSPHERESFPAPDDQPPFVGVQLARPRRCAAAGAPAGPLPHGDVNQAAARKIPANSHNPAQRHHASHRVKLLCPLDTSSPHGCRVECVIGMVQSRGQRLGRNPRDPAFVTIMESPRIKMLTCRFLRVRQEIWAVRGGSWRGGLSMVAARPVAVAYRPGQIQPQPGHRLIGAGWPALAVQAKLPGRPGLPVPAPIMQPRHSAGRARRCRRLRWPRA